MLITQPFVFKLGLFRCTSELISTVYRVVEIVVARLIDHNTFCFFAYSSIQYEILKYKNHLRNYVSPGTSHACFIITLMPYCQINHIVAPTALPIGRTCINNIFYSV